MTARQALLRVLQLAYSGELGAALAYRGHAASVADPRERQRIEDIRLEELDHRQRVGRMLRSLGGRPDALLELRNRGTGASVALFCHIGGWFLPMYGAGWIERRNIAEYERAAVLAAQCAEHAFADELLTLAEVEWEHERYFRLRAASHPLSRLLRVWRAPPSKEDIRRAFVTNVGPTRAGWRAAVQPGHSNTSSPRSRSHAVAEPRSILGLGGRS